MTNITVLNNEYTEEMAYHIQMMFDEIAMATNNEIEETADEIISMFSDIDLALDYLEEKYL